MMGFQSVVKFLFEGLEDGWNPQIGLAGVDKRALIWCPGNKPTSPDRFREVLVSPLLQFYGLTNRAYQDCWSSQHNQTARLCWSGLDIDAEDNPGYKPDDLANHVARLLPEASIRRSCGGSGLHAFLRFSNPVDLPTIFANTYTKAINRDYVARLSEAGISVCKSDSRMFWVAGGRNVWLKQVETRIENRMLPESFHAESAGLIQPVAADTIQVMPQIRVWLDRLAAGGVRIKVGCQNPVNIGCVIDVLQAHGQTIRTKSGLTSRTGTNGYIDCGHNWISLWTYADNRAVWIVTDDLIDSML